MSTLGLVCLTTPSSDLDPVDGSRALSILIPLTHSTFRLSPTSSCLLHGLEARWT